MSTKIEDMILVDYKIDYKADDFKDLPTISNCILKIELQKKQVIEDFHDSNATMPKEIYEKGLASINQLYDNFLQPLKMRHKKILSQIILNEQTACKLDELRTNKRVEIETAFQRKTLRYENKLYKKQCYIKYCADKAAARARFKTMVAVRIKNSAGPFIITDGSYRPP